MVPTEHFSGDLHLRVLGDKLRGNLHSIHNLYTLRNDMIHHPVVTMKATTQRIDLGKNGYQSREAHYQSTLAAPIPIQSGTPY